MQRDPSFFDLGAHRKQPVEVPDTALLLGADVADLTRQLATPLPTNEPISGPLGRFEQPRCPRLRGPVPDLAIGILDQPRPLGIRLTHRLSHQPLLVAPRKDVLPWRGQRQQRDRAAVMGDIRAELPLEREPPTASGGPLPARRHRPPAAPTRAPGRPTITVPILLPAHPPARAGLRRREPPARLRQPLQLDVAELTRAEPVHRQSRNRFARVVEAHRPRGLEPAAKWAQSPQEYRLARSHAACFEPSTAHRLNHAG
jgi:hypothetical protein